MVYSVNMKLSALLEDPAGAALFDRFLPGMRKMVAANPQAGSLSLEQLVRYARVPQGEQLLESLGRELEKLNTPENRISPAERALIQRFQELDRQDQSKPKAKTASHTQDAFYPGQPWLDTKGEPIQAHGGAVYFEDGVYYWYGENKEHTDGKNGVWTWGIKVYASTDLYNWEDRGFLIPPVLDDPNAALFPAKRVDRPHILKCPATGKYVCWIKLSGPEAAFTVWQADRLLGPYRMVENLYNPGGHKAGDFDLVSDEKTGKGYLYFDADHRSMLCMELTEDYLHAGREVAKSYPNLHPPFTREAPALFERGGRKYMLTSGMTGYVPNQSAAAVSDAWDIPFEHIGNPHPEDETNASFNSQICKVFRVEGSGLLIAMADRWLPGYPVDARIADLFTRVIAEKDAPDRYHATPAERQEMLEANVLETADTSVAGYVWLPVTIQADMPEIRWSACWRLQEFSSGE